MSDSLLQSAERETSHASAAVTFAQGVLPGRQGSPLVDVGLALAVSGARDEPRLRGRDERTFLTLRRGQIEQEPDLLVDAPIRADKSSLGAALQANGGSLIAR